MTFRDDTWKMTMSEKSKIPKPVGYRVLVKLPDVKETYGESGIIKSTKEQHNEQIMSISGEIVDMGESAYVDEDRFPNGPWCAVGDYVIFRANTGTRFKIDGVEYRLMNDDSIEAVVEDPRDLTRAA